MYGEHFFFIDKEQLLYLKVEELLGGARKIAVV